MRHDVVCGVVGLKVTQITASESWASWYDVIWVINVNWFGVLDIIYLLFIINLFYVDKT